MITGGDCNAQIGRRRISPYWRFTGLLFDGQLKRGRKAARLIYLYHFVMYSPMDSRKIADMLKMDPIVWLTHDVFVSHSYPQHVDAEYVGTHNMRYHFYIFPDDVILQDRTLLAYGWSLDKSIVREGNLHVAKTYAN